MSLSTWLANVVRAVDTEYDRRIRRASNVVTYDAGDGHSSGVNGESVTPTDSVALNRSEESFEDDGVEIVNVPRGTRLSPPRVAVAAPEDRVLVESR